MAIRCRHKSDAVQRGDLGGKNARAAVAVSKFAILSLTPGPHVARRVDGDGVVATSSDAARALALHIALDFAGARLDVGALARVVSQLVVRFAKRAHDAAHARRSGRMLLAQVSHEAREELHGRETLAVFGLVERRAVAEEQPDDGKPGSVVESAMEGRPARLHVDGVYISASENELLARVVHSRRACSVERGRARHAPSVDHDAANRTRLFLLSLARMLAARRGGGRGGRGFGGGRLLCRS